MEGKTIGWRTYLDDEDFVPNILINGAKEGEHAVFMVDVGGGKGHDLQKLALKYPNSPGKLVLQDLKGPIDEAKASNLDDQIVTMEYDFFNEQPIQGRITEIEEVSFAKGGRCKSLFRQMHHT